MSYSRPEAQGNVFADVRMGTRVVGTKIMNERYIAPEGWGNSAGDTIIAKAGEKPIKRQDAILMLLQPDTSLDLSPSSCPTHTYCQMFKRTEELIETLQEQTPEKLQELMDLGKKMAKSHAERFQGFSRLPPKQAALLFGGKSLRAGEFSDSERRFAETRLRIISGLYGVLRPYDDVKPVRDVPMNGMLKTARGDSILEFWGESITKQINKDMNAAGAEGGGQLLLVNCLTDEYRRAIQMANLTKGVQSILVDFDGANEEHMRKGWYLFARWCIRKRVDNIHLLQEFEHDDWILDKRKSSSTRIVFSWGGDEAGAKKEKKKKKKDKDKDKEKDDGDGKAGYISADSEEYAAKKEKAKPGRNPGYISEDSDEYNARMTAKAKEKSKAGYISEDSEEYAAKGKAAREAPPRDASEDSAPPPSDDSGPPRKTSARNTGGREKRGRAPPAGACSRSRSRKRRGSREDGSDEAERRPGGRRGRGSAEPEPAQRGRGGRRGRGPSDEEEVERPRRSRRGRAAADSEEEQRPRGGRRRRSRS